MKSYKKINFQYFRVKFSDGNKRVLYDLREWIDSIHPLSLRERTININGYPSRLESEELLEKKYIHMRFVKMSESFLPELAYEDAETEPLELDDDEYIAVDVNTIYDPDTHILMIQNNRGSLSADRIVKYINQYALDHNIFNPGEFLIIEPLKNSKKFSSIENKVYKKLEIHFDDVKNLSEYDGGSIGEILKLIQMAGGNTGVFQIGLGRGSSKSRLNEDTVEAYIGQICNSNFVSSANVSIKDDYETYRYDLFDNTLVDSEIFEVESRTSLSCIVVRAKMLSRYKKRRGDFIIK